MADDLTLAIDGQKISGWQEISVTLLALGFPNSFAVTLSDIDPVLRAKIHAQAGDSCQVSLGDDIVITGYIDRDISSVEPDGHQLQIVGRGKTQDLVDCSAQWPNGQIAPATTFDIATKLAAAYGVTVRQVGDPVTTLNPQFSLNYGESCEAIIQRLAHAGGLLAYEDSAGALVLTRVGVDKAGSAIVYGQNVQAASVQNAMDGRFSQVICTMGAENSYGELDEASFFFFTASDPNVKRPRLLYLPLEVSADPPAIDFTETKAKWEIARRAGLGSVVNATVDSWRDKAGKLWRPNTLVEVDIPGFRNPEKTLCIASVTFVRNDSQGTIAQLAMMPPSAFAPEPISLQPVSIADVEPVAQQ